MDFTFLRPSGEVAFFRSDAEQADWTQEELNLNCTFPYKPDKVIERGMVILFRDPALDDWHAYEIRQCILMPGEFYQQFTAEDIAVSELTDCHIPEKIELTDVSAADALEQLLRGTGWEVGEVAGGISSGDITRGSVWQNVSVISGNWNVYVWPRVTVNSSGISGRYLDILPSSGFDRGLRLAVNKNVTDPCVTYDDTGLYTALYGYGGTYASGSTQDRVTLEYNFADVVWSRTADHPAKPQGQKFIEDPEATALYGRNGRPRFGYYQNTNIKDPAILLQKTWEALKGCREPKISITGTVADLKRMGYKDIPLRLHDMAIIELEPVGLLFYRQIIRLTVDLLDPTKNLPEIGNYIPNIIYINRETENAATGGGGGSGGGRGSSKIDLEMSKYQTRIYDTGETVGMYARVVDEQGNVLRQAGMHIDPETGVLIYDEDYENNIGSKFKVQREMIESEVYARTAEGQRLSSRITQNANSISLEVAERKGAINGLNSQINIQKDRISLVVTDGTNPKIKPAAIVNSINSSGSEVRISADHIILDGDAVAQSLWAKDLQAASLDTTGDINGADINGEDITANGKIYGTTLGVGSHDASWKSKSVITGITRSNTRYIVYAINGSTENLGTMIGSLVTDTDSETIYYLGR